MYYLDNIQNPQYKIIKNDTDLEYKDTAHYYKLNIDKYPFDSLNINSIWKNILVDPNNKEEYYLENQQIFYISYYSEEEIIKIFNE